MACDCNDSDANTYPGAPEVNDGVDNQCAGDYGDGLVDELAPTVRFFSQTGLGWDYQAGAQQYQVARAQAFIPMGNEPRNPFCVFATETLNGTVISVNPNPGFLDFYLVRASLPNPGSWGAATSGERIITCGT